MDHRVRGELAHQRDRVVAGPSGGEIGQRLPDETPGRRDTVRDRGKRHPRGGERPVRVWRWFGRGPNVKLLRPSARSRTLIVRRLGVKTRHGRSRVRASVSYRIELGPEYSADHPRATLDGPPALSRPTAVGGHSSMAPCADRRGRTPVTGSAAPVTSPVRISAPVTCLADAPAPDAHMPLAPLVAGPMATMALSSRSWVPLSAASRSTLPSTMVIPSWLQRSCLSRSGRGSRARDTPFIGAKRAIPLRDPRYGDPCRGRVALAQHGSGRFTHGDRRSLRHHTMPCS